MRRLAVLVVLASLSTAGCDRQPEAITAPAIHYGQDVCAECSMIISDERFAGAIGVRRDGRVDYLLFDDVGEMLAFTPPEHEAIRWFATDAATRAWLDAEQAVFLRSKHLVTPMGTGVGAYADRSAAEAVQQTYGGKILTFGELVGAGGE